MSQPAAAVGTFFVFLRRNILSTEKRKETGIICDLKAWFQSYFRATHLDILDVFGSLPKL